MHVEAPQLATEIYLDNHATTRTDPRVVDAMLPWMLDDYANAGSTTHEPGRRVAAKVEACREQIAAMIKTDPEGLVFTSGATESINLAILGVILHPRQKRRKILSVRTEHRAGLDPLHRLEKMGFQVVRLPVEQCDPKRIGCLDLDLMQAHLDTETAMVSVMMGNNEIGTLDNLAAISERCHSVGALLHSDATQAIGKVPVDMRALGIDLLSFSAHKFYGPKGIGGLAIDQNRQTVRLQPQIVGGGQQSGIRSGTLNSVGIVGMAHALEISMDELSAESHRVSELRQRLWDGLQGRIAGLQLNGPDWNHSSSDIERSTVRSSVQPNLHPTRTPSTKPHQSASAGSLSPGAIEPLGRLPGNLNVCFPNVDGQSIMLKLPGLAVSSGSACTSAEPHPSHVLLAIGRTEDQARASLRFGIGRFNTADEIERTVEWISAAYSELVAFVA